LNSELAESSQFDEFEKEEYAVRVNTQGKNSFKNDSKERLKNDLMPNNFEQSKSAFLLNSIINNFREKRKSLILWRK